MITLNARKKVAALSCAIAFLNLSLFAIAGEMKNDASTSSKQNRIEIKDFAFNPQTITVKSGETVTWTNNIGFPHNVVFDEDGIPAGASADKLSHEDYLNSPGETVSSTFDKPGEYSYYCEPHQGAGMAGKIIVQ